MEAASLPERAHAALLQRGALGLKGPDRVRQGWDERVEKDPQSSADPLSMARGPEALRD
jgi:hypothetical protein